MASKKTYLEKAAGEMTKFFTGAEVETDQQEDTRKPLNEKELAALKYYSQYKSGTITQEEIAKKVGWKDKSSVSRAFSHIEKEYPELLQEPQQPTEATKQAEPIESKPEPETAQEKPRKPQKNYIKFNLGEYTDYVKTMAGFRRTNVTNYIQDLIAEDMKKNADIYEKLKNM